MKIYLKPVAFTLGVMITGISYSVNAQPTLFNFMLTVEDASGPQIFVGRDKKAIAPVGHNTFRVPTRQSDYFFSVQYQHEGKTKEATCEISGVPSQITATIDPTKDGRNACKTQEVGRRSYS